MLEETNPINKSLVATNVGVHEGFAFSSCAHLSFYIGKYNNHLHNGATRTYTLLPTLGNNALWLAFVLFLLARGLFIWIATKGLRSILSFDRE